MEDCVFCKIVKGEIPCDKVYEDDQIIVFNDIHPQAPVHLLVIPKKHIKSIAVMNEKDVALVGQMVNIATRIAAAAGISAKGFRLVTNSGEEGGQVVPHLHWHILGGRQLSGELG
ncbi:MAG: histidine triad nucleotide-binding protein [Dehalococcoidales bacterium]|nr:histidine triad nucleotide-binding protein [Dehalococcoidales bacterium]MDD4321972.1 histidine triad nucleotide-binding protein [Dehalococcoidales bacterium]MDD5498197.1 histidine triad nucleotide-binding protein [Dehalococcoidales bacterium]